MCPRARLQWLKLAKRVNLTVITTIRYPGTPQVPIQQNTPLQPSSHIFFTGYRGKKGVPRAVAGSEPRRQQGYSRSTSSKNPHNITRETLQPQSRKQGGMAHVVQALGFDWGDDTQHGDHLAKRDFAPRAGQRHHIVPQFEKLKIPEFRKESPAHPHSMPSFCVRFVVWSSRGD